MLEKLLQFADVPHWPGAFTLGNTIVWQTCQNDPHTVEIVPRPMLRCFVLRAWRVYGGMTIAYSTPVEFGLCGEVLVLHTDSKHTITDHTGAPLDGIYYNGRDRRICNRLIAAQMIDWTK